MLEFTIPRRLCIDGVMAFLTAFRSPQKSRLAGADEVIRLLDGLEGKLTSSKWALIEKCSPDTALRDITGLVEQGILKKDKAGEPSTSYSLA
jgi:Fic family protein